MIHQVNLISGHRLQIIDNDLQVHTTEEIADSDVLTAMQAVWQWAEQYEPLPQDTIEIGGRVYRLAETETEEVEHE